MRKELARRALEPAEVAWSHMGGPAERPGGGTERGTERETERSVPGMWWYHRSSSPTGKKERKKERKRERERERERERDRKQFCEVEVS